ncbi:hypothetical protein [Corallococcus sp. AS-1-6]|uniref:hypothetical protein n=1 Tax=Corallococcus sp. AS-1-6 TaxID=2874599 RepID=UPI001CBAE182|nr:hypothetical protein [Corallococcus sp. AS-1-6]MBZ4370132.1 hypothetical protein [Corallococcus sp. AS-1-6]
MTLRVPPAVEVLNDKALWTVDTPEGLYKLLKGGLAKELNVQAERTLDGGTYELNLPAPRDTLSLTPGASLDPFSRISKCNAIPCLRDRTARFVQTLGLLADAIVIPDPFTPLFQDPKVSENVTIELFRRLQVYAVMRPLVEGGVVKFGAPGAKYCASCASRIESGLKNAAKLSALDVVEQAKFDVRFVDDRTCVLTFEAPDDYGFYRMIQLDGDDRALLNGYRLVPGRSLARSAARRLLPGIVRGYVSDLLDALVHMQGAEADGTYFASGSQYDARLLHSLGRIVSAAPPATQLNSLADVQLPWVGELTPEQVIVLRAEAQTALPRFRAYFAELLSSKSPGEVAAEIEGLQYAASEVEAELLAASRIAFGKKVVAAGGLGLAVFSSILGGDAAITAVGALVTAASAAHAIHGAGSERIQSLKRDPSFVLVKAKSIFEDTHR